MKGKIHGLDLFSGIGGLSIALETWVKPVAFCEKDKHTTSILLDRMLDGEVSVAPVWDDVRTLKGEFLPAVDIIYGGFPCQDISVAGAGRGLEGKRSGLFVHIIRLAEEIRPAFIFLENVPAIRTRGLGVVLRSLHTIGYDARWTVVSAQEVGAPHLRKRWFLLAHPNSKRLRIEWPWGERGETKVRSIPSKHGPVWTVAYPDDEAESQQIGSEETETGSGSRSGSSLLSNTDREHGHDERYGASPILREFGKAPILQGRRWWESEPPVGRVVNGLPNRVDRLKALGNAVVPFQARVAFERLMGSSK